MTPSIPLRCTGLILALLCAGLTSSRLIADEPASEKLSQAEAAFLSNTRQLTFAGKRSGEGYFSADGKQLVFQSEREPGNPFFQIYLLDLETGDERRISPGHGKTTCAWIHPDGQRVLFSSTHADPAAREKQQEELKNRAEGKEKRYSWDYDPTYEIYEYNLQTDTYQKLTDTLGYDAEASYSPDGQWIAFASNRQAYQRELTDEEQKQLELDPSYFMEIYLMKADGSEVRQLTDSKGYDGGPFFSPDGQRICWRRFSEDGATAEIMTMNVDGTDSLQLTNWKVMSWAPFYHPSGDYLIFTTNRHGFSNFELYLVSTEKDSTPIRVTDTEGFDGLPAFSPDGKALVWTSNRTAGKQSQLFRADWNHELAVELLQSQGLTLEQTKGTAQKSARQSDPDFKPADIARHVNFLCREELAGRLTGTEGEKLATQYVATYFEELGLEPGGENDTYFQEFEFTAGIDLGETNRLQSGEQSLKLNEDWRPVSFSATGEFTASKLAFAGYGIVAPAAKDYKEYDAYVHLDVQDKWVVVFRFLPEEITPEHRQHWAHYSSLRYKAMVARDRGAKGLIVVSGPNSQVKDPLVALRFDGSLAGTSIPVLSVTDDVVNTWLKPTGKTLKQWQDQLDTGEPVMGFVVPAQPVTAQIEIQQVKRTGRNVIGILRAPPAGHPLPALLVGAHIDHLGRGGTSSSLAKEGEQEQIHYGADDNASGTAGMLEIAEYLSSQQRKNQLPLARDVVFAAWSGEELGLYGASHYVKQLQEELASLGDLFGAAPTPKDQQSTKDQKAEAEKDSKSQKSEQPTAAEKSALRWVLAACLNMDMIGRFDEAVVLQGVGSSSVWKPEIEKRNIVVGLPITLQNDSYIPTDASIFFMNGIPILSAFTGTHTDYHTPRDTPDKLNYEAAARIARLMGLIARGLATSADSPDYISQERPEEQRRANLRAYLGTIPDYAASDLTGVKISGVGKSGPADVAGLKGGDIIVELAGKKIENIYDYTYGIEALKIGQKTKIAILRGDKRLEFEITPGSRE